MIRRKSRYLRKISPSISTCSNYQHYQGKFHGHRFFLVLFTSLHCVCVSCLYVCLGHRCQSWVFSRRCVQLSAISFELRFFTYRQFTGTYEHFPILLDQPIIKGRGLTKRTKKTQAIQSVTITRIVVGSSPIIVHMHFKQLF